MFLSLWGMMHLQYTCSLAPFATKYVHGFFNTTFANNKVEANQSK